MEENIDNIQEEKDLLGSGAMLAQARKELGKSVEEIATELNLSITQIKTIELDQSEGLPEPTYVRGYIRSYANLVGLNPEDVLSHYLNKNWQKSTNLDDLPRGISDNEHSEASMFSPARVIAFIVIASLIGFLVYSGTLSSLIGNRSNGESSSSRETANSVISISEPPESQILEDADSDSQDAANDDTQADDQLLSQQDTAVSEEDRSAEESLQLSTPMADTEGQTTVVLSFTDTSWVDIRDENQNRLAYQSYPAGETLEVSEEGILSILLGNAQGVQMKLNGSDYDLGQHTEGVYAKFSVGEPKQ